jgi:hypothetical protein
MVEVEIDVFSGRPNPTFGLSDGEEAELVERLVAEPGQMAPLADPETLFGLGYRGVIVRQLKVDGRAWSGAEVPGELSDELPGPRGRLPVEVRLGSRDEKRESAADWLLSVSERKRLDLSDEVWEVLREGVRLVPPPPEGYEQAPEPGFEAVEEDVPADPPEGATWWACNSAWYGVNHQYFNDPAHVQRNNCYCFASNHLANVRGARPGRRAGRPTPDPITGIGVVDGLRADGWIDGCQVNTLTIAAAVWRNEDYHFYRVVTGGPEWWWEHKPGITPARWTDESNQPLFSGRGPVNCNRGRYKDFCGYFYQNNDTAYVA